MTLKDLYGKVKSKSFIKNENFGYFLTFVLATIITVASLALYVLIVQLLWNWLAPILSLAKLGFLETAGFLLLIKLLAHSIVINTQRTRYEERYK